MVLWTYYMLRSATLLIASVLIVVLGIRLTAVLQRLLVLLNAAKRYAQVQLLTATSSSEFLLGLPSRTGA